MAESREGTAGGGLLAEMTDEQGWVRLSMG